MARLVWLGKLADLAGAAETDLDGTLDWDGLLARLPAPLAAEVASDRVRVALNGVVLADKAQLRASAGDEVAFLPPVSGG